MISRILAPVVLILLMGVNSAMAKVHLPVFLQSKTQPKTTVVTPAPRATITQQVPASIGVKPSLPSPTQSLVSKPSTTKPVTPPTSKPTALPPIDLDQLRIKSSWVDIKETSQFLRAVQDFTTKRMTVAPFDPRTHFDSPKTFLSTDVESRLNQCGFRRWSEKELPIPEVLKGKPEYRDVLQKVLGKMYLFTAPTSKVSTYYGVVNIAPDHRVMCRTFSEAKVETTEGLRHSKPTLKGFTISSSPPAADICELAQKISCPPLKKGGKTK